MEMLLSLGINETIFFQIFIFIAIFAFLIEYVFKPYHLAYLKRSEIHQSTHKGFESINDETKALKEKYEKKAKELNEKCQRIYFKRENEAFQLKEKILKEVTEESQKWFESSQKSLENQSKNLINSLELKKDFLSQTILDQLLKFKDRTFKGSTSR